MEFLEDKAKKINFVRTEMNLMEFPIFLISSNVQKDAVKKISIEKSIKRSDGNFYDIKWEISTVDKLPSVSDFKYFLGLLKLYQEKGYPSDGKLYFTRYELAKLLGRNYDGRFYKDVDQAIKLYKMMNIIANQSWYDIKEKKHKTVLESGTSLIWDYVLKQESKEEGSLNTRKRSYIAFNKTLIDSIKNGYLKAIDLNFINDIKSPIAIRIFSLISKWINKKDVIKLELSTMASSIPLKKASASRQLQVLDNPNKELQEAGFLKNVDYGTSKNGSILLTYTLTDGNKVMAKEENSEFVDLPELTEEEWIRSEIFSNPEYNFLRSEIEWADKFELSTSHYSRLRWILEELCDISQIKDVEYLKKIIKMACASFPKYSPSDIDESWGMTKEDSRSGKIRGDLINYFFGVLKTFPPRKPIQKPFKKEALSKT